MQSVIGGGWRNLSGVVLFQSSVCGRNGVIGLDVAWLLFDASVVA